MHVNGPSRCRHWMSLHYDFSFFNKFCNLPDSLSFSPRARPRYTGAGLRLVELNRLPLLCGRRGRSLRHGTCMSLWRGRGIAPQNGRRSAKNRCTKETFGLSRPALRTWLAPYSRRKGKVAPSMLRKRLERDRKLRELARFCAPA